MTSTPITLESLETTRYTQVQIQDENVRHGLARCRNEKKDKSIDKLRRHLWFLRSQESVIKPIEAEEAVTAVVASAPRKSIPKKIRAEVWRAHFGRSTDGFCVCCRAPLGILDEWQAGHIIAHNHGGADTADNLKPVCASCNRSMGTESMTAFVARCYPTHTL